MKLSYWEIDTYFNAVDYVVIGSGIVGLSTAYHLRLKHPNAKIIVLEKGRFPEGASTKNAGFACFGTLSEVLGYLEHQSEEEIYSLVKKRYEGLQRLRSILGDKNIDFQQLGGVELYLKKDQELWEKSLENRERINTWLKPIFGEEVYRVSTQDFGFNSVHGMIQTPFEGHIHTGEMMNSFVKKVISNDIPILNNLTVTNLSDNKTNVELELNHSFTFKAKRVYLCTNAFTQQLYDLDVVPARGQVLITKPIDNLKVLGNFHIEEGFYYFRNQGNRVLFGGARNIDIEGETTTEFETTEIIQNQLETYLKEIILPDQPFEVENRWSGIMGMGKEKTPIIKRVSENISCGVRLSSIGVAIGSLVGEELANL